MIGPPLLGRTVSPGPKFLCMVTSLSGQLIAMSQGYSRVQEGRRFGVPCRVPSSHRCAPLLVEEQKIPAWPNTLRYSATPAYSLIGPPARPGYPSISHPTTSTQVLCGAGLKLTRAL